MKLKAILFDLDGTLLPMDQDVFLKDYFSRMVKKLAPHGYDSQALIKSIYAGTNAMIANDGSATNETVFWNSFTNFFGEQARKDEVLFDDYYRNEFQEVKHSCGFLPEATTTIKTLRDRGYRVVLATNPLFPSIATESRIRWAGMSPEDFELFTTYENSSFCKPNLKYYEEILGKLGVTPEECLMVGNDVGDDMVAEQLGMKVFLVPRDLINKEEKDISNYPQGTLDDLLTYLDTLQEN